MRINEEKFLINRIYRDFISYFSAGATADEIKDSLFGSKILLQYSSEENSKIISNGCIEEIKKTLPSIQRIIDKPRSFIKSIEEKVLVETAKRINNQAISHLSRDSNDWHARTLLSVKPKYIVSDINEETLDLYENRFIKTLIDKILSLVIERRIYLENVINKLEDEINKEIIQNSFGYDYKRFDKQDYLVKSLLKKNEDAYSVGLYNELESELKQIRELEKKINFIKSSKFYNALRKCKKTDNPIERTNILLFDQNYNKCYKLWNFLNNENNSDEMEIDTEYDELKNYLDNFYFAYVCLNVIGTMLNNDYKFENNAFFNFENYIFYCSEPLRWIKNNDLLISEFDTVSNRIKFSYCIDKKSGKWDNFEIYTNYTDFERKSRNDIMKITDDIITGLMTKNKKENISGKYCVLSFDINACSVNNDFGELLYRRFFNIGDNYSDTEKNIKDISNYKTGIIMVTPMDIRYNFLHIARIINYHILINKDFKSFKNKCPVCGSANVRDKNGDLLCYDCGHAMSISTCANCHDDNILWVKYINDKALMDKKIIESFNNKPYYFQLMKYEMIMGQYAISSFRFTNEKGVWKLKSVCPDCGVLLGDKKYNIKQ